MEQRIRTYGVTGIALVVFLAFMLLPAYGASKPETGYYILTGSFEKLTNAEQELKRLKKYNASITEESLSGKKWYRVSIGPYMDMDKAKSMARQLKRKKVIASYNIKIMAKADVYETFGNPSQTPFFISLSGSGMFLRGTGKHPQFVPASGGSYGTTREEPDNGGS
jgi:hypothetical protein